MGLDGNALVTELWSVKPWFPLREGLRRCYKHFLMLALKEWWWAVWSVNLKYSCCSLETYLGCWGEMVFV